MGFIDDFNDSFGNVDRSRYIFTTKHPDEEIIYSSNGVLFLRKGNHPLQRCTKIFNRRGNLLISDKRCFFHNPIISGEIFSFLMMSIVLFIMVFLEVILLTFGYLVSSSIFQSCICGLVPFPFLFLFAIFLGIAITQRIPQEIDLSFDRMESRSLDKYQFLTRVSPMFSCFDGKSTYYFVGYRVLNEEQTIKIKEIF